MNWNGKSKPKPRTDKFFSDYKSSFYIVSVLLLPQEQHYRQNNVSIHYIEELEIYGIRFVVDKKRFGFFFGLKEKIRSINIVSKWWKLSRICNKLHYDSANLEIRKVNTKQLKIICVCRWRRFSNFSRRHKRDFDVWMLDS